MAWKYNLAFYVVIAFVISIFYLEFRDEFTAPKPITHEEFRKEAREILSEPKSCNKIVNAYGEDENKGPAGTNCIFCFYFELEDGSKISVCPIEYHRYSIGDCYP